MTRSAASLSFTLLMNSLRNELDSASWSSAPASTSLQTTTLPQPVMASAWCDASAKTQSTKRKLMEIARAGKWRSSFASFRSCGAEFQLATTTEPEHTYPLTKDESVRGGHDEHGRVLGVAAEADALDALVLGRQLEAFCNET